MILKLFTSKKKPLRIGSLIKQITPVTCNCHVEGWVFVPNKSWITAVDKLSFLLPSIPKTFWFSSNVKCLDERLIFRVKLKNVDNSN